MPSATWPAVRSAPGPWSAGDLARMTAAGFQKHLGIRLVSAAPELVRLELPLERHHANSAGTVHGGVLMALADSAGAMGALLNLPEGAITATVDSRTLFLRPPRGQRLLAEAEPVHLGRTRMIWRTRILSDAGRLCAEVTQTQIILSQTGGPDDQH